MACKRNITIVLVALGVVLLVVLISKRKNDENFTQVPLTSRSLAGTSSLHRPIIPSALPPRISANGYAAIRGAEPPRYLQGVDQDMPIQQHDFDPSMYSELTSGNGVSASDIDAYAAQKYDASRYMEARELLPEDSMTNTTFGKSAADPNTWHVDRLMTTTKRSRYHRGGYDHIRGMPSHIIPLKLRGTDPNDIRGVAADPAVDGRLGFMNLQTIGAPMIEHGDIVHDNVAPSHNAYGKITPHLQSGMHSPGSLHTPSAAGVTHFRG